MAGNVSTQGDDIEELIGKVLSNEGTVEETERLEKWCQLSASNLTYFNQLKSIFEKAASSNQALSFDADLAWNSIKPRLTTTPVVSIHRNTKILYWLAAASVTAIILVTGYLINTGSTIQQNLTAQNAILKDTLPDGNLVALNRKSALSYQYNRISNQRLVKLKGEAYFDIIPQTKAVKGAFIVDAGGVFIRDIGTKFNVMAYADSATIEVTVEEGEVIFYTESNEGIRIVAPGSGVYTKATGEFKLTARVENANSYQSKRFVFENLPLSEAVKQLNRVYDTQIILSKKIEACPVTVTFDDEDPALIAEILATTFNLTIRVTNGNYYLDGTACDPQ